SNASHSLPGIRHRRQLFNENEGLKVRIVKWSDLPPTIKIGTFEIYSIFEKYGNITKIKVPENRKRAFLEFEKLPKVPFWRERGFIGKITEVMVDEEVRRIKPVAVRLELEYESIREQSVESPMDDRKKFPMLMVNPFAVLAVLF